MIIQCTSLKLSPWASLPPPESNGMAESFVKTFKRDYTSMHELKDATTVME